MARLRDRSVSRERASRRRERCRSPLKITDLKFKGRGQRDTPVTDASPELLRRCYL